MNLVKTLRWVNQGGRMATGDTSEMQFRAKINVETSNTPGPSPQIKPFVPTQNMKCLSLIVQDNMWYEP